MSDRPGKDPGAEGGAPSVPPAERPTRQPAAAADDGVTNETALVPADDAPHPAERAAQREYAFAPFDDGNDDGLDEATAIDSRHRIAEMQTSIIQELPQNPYLECIKGPDAGKVFTLQQGETAVGRAVENDAVLTDVSVSRRHFTLKWDGTGVRLRDLGSGNGTKVNEKRAYETALADGDVIVCGETHFMMKIPSAAATVVPLATRSGEPPKRVSAPPADKPVRSAATEAPTVLGDRAVGPVMVALAPWIARARAHPRISAAVGIFVLLLLGWLAFRTPSAPDGDGPQLADQYFAAGMARYVEGNYREAELAFEAALKAQPDHAEARKYFERAEQALSHEERLRLARQALYAGDLARAEREASAVPVDSPVAAQANLLIQQVALRRAQAETAKTPSTKRGAESAKTPERASPSTSSTPKTATKSQSSTWREIPNPTKTKSDDGDAPKRVLALYKSGDFAGAADAADQAADKASGDERKTLRELSDRITRFQKAYEQASRPGASVELLQSAVNLDQLISGGSYASKLSSTLLGAYLDAAKQAFERDSMTKACEATRQAAQVRPSDARVTTYVRRCEEYAGSLMDDAADAEKSNKTKARDLYRKAMLLLPPTSSVYREASKRLSALGKAARQDEDE